MADQDLETRRTYMLRELSDYEQKVTDIAQRIPALMDQIAQINTQLSVLREHLTTVTTRLSTQADFLRRCGIDAFVDEGRVAWEAAAATGDLASVRGRSRVTESEALLDPAGLGGFLVGEWAVPTPASA